MRYAEEETHVGENQQQAPGGGGGHIQRQHGPRGRPSHRCLGARWRAEYGGLRADQARRLKQLEKENSRLKRVVAELTLDNQILKEAAEGNF